MSNPLYKLQVSTGSEKLADRLQKDIMLLLNQYANVFESGGERSAALKAMQNIRRLDGWK